MADEAAVSVQEFLHKRKRLYVEIFESPVGKNLLADLAKFCRAHDTTFHPDPRVAANLDGRREVWLRIQHHLQLSTEELWTLYGSKQ